jgi:hypothetical protein
MRVYPLDQTNELGCVFRTGAGQTVQDLVRMLTQMKLQR